MIPDYLRGKSAAQIVDRMRHDIWTSQTGSGEEATENYVRHIEILLLLAVKDALMNADGKNLCDNDYGLMGSEAECRAIAFLNKVKYYRKR